MRRSPVRAVWRGRPRGGKHRDERPTELKANANVEIEIRMSSPCACAATGARRRRPPGYVLDTEGVLIRETVRSTDQISAGTREQLSTMYRLSLESTWGQHANGLVPRVVEVPRSFQIVVCTYREDDYLSDAVMPTASGTPLRLWTMGSWVPSNLGFAIRRVYSWLTTTAWTTRTRVLAVRGGGASNSGRPADTLGVIARGITDARLLEARSIGRGRSADLGEFFYEQLPEPFQFSTPCHVKRFSAWYSDRERRVVNLWR